MLLRNSIGTFAILAVIFLAGPAFAHPKLESASPAPDVSVITSPKEIRLNFSEGIIAKFSGVELKDEGGHIVTTGDPVTDSKKQLVVPVSTPLAPGRYTVSWHAVSEDTHKVNGDYSFRVIAENAPSLGKSEGSRDGNDDSAAGRTKEEAGNKECVCKDSERNDRVQERSRDWDRDWDPRDRYHDRNPNYANRDSRSRPDCVVDDDGYRYCRVR